MTTAFRTGGGRGAEACVRLVSGASAMVARTRIPYLCPLGCRRFLTVLGRLLANPVDLYRKHPKRNEKRHNSHRNHPTFLCVFEDYRRRGSEFMAILSSCIVIIRSVRMSTTSSGRGYSRNGGVKHGKWRSHAYRIGTNRSHTAGDPPRAAGNARGWSRKEDFRASEAICFGYLRPFGPCIAISFGFILSVSLFDQRCCW